MQGRKYLVDWLRDAHAMEQQAVAILERQVERLQSYPELSLRIREHAIESRRQADQIEQCIHRLDGNTSAVKDAVGKVSAGFGALLGSTAPDEVVKDTLANYAFEHFEIACYRSLVAAAEAVGDVQTARVCADILREEEAMAAWLADHVAEVTRAYMERDLAGLQAKR